MYVRGRKREVKEVKEGGERGKKCMSEREEDRG